MLKRLVYAWTPQDEAKLKELAEQGKHLRTIALRLKRSESSIKKRAHDLGIQVKANPRYRAHDLGRDFRVTPGIS
jgi:DNA-binding NarL/FixJ family response regulator